VTWIGGRTRLAPNQITAQGIVELLGTAVRSHDRREASEMRAELASIVDALKACSSPIPGRHHFDEEAFLRHDCGPQIFRRS
jgi:hypothetical protein